MSEEAAPVVVTPGTFDPGKFITKVNGSDYLEVKWRLVWLRDRHPDAVVETELLDHAPGEGATFRCQISLPGGGSATGHGSESAGDFRDYLEKAETKAIGRACAALGFGTQFCDDFLSGERLVDSPVKQPQRQSQSRQQSRQTQPRQSAQQNQPAPLPAAETQPPLSRADLLAQLKSEQDRIGVDHVLAYIQKNIGKTTKTDFTDAELRKTLSWAKEQPNLAA